LTLGYEPPTPAELREYYELELAETPSDFLLWRHEWLTDPGSVRLQLAGDGWDVVLRIDGTYFVEDLARCMVELFQREVHGLAEQLCAYKFDEQSCPTCGKSSMFIARHHFHTDGSDNQQCWAAGAPERKDT
jgi:ribosomal protein S27AE